MTSACVGRGADQSKSDSGGTTQHTNRPCTHTIHSHTAITPTHIPLKQQVGRQAFDRVVRDPQGPLATKAVLLVTNKLEVGVCVRERVCMYVGERECVSECVCHSIALHVETRHITTHSPPPNHET